LRYDRRVTASEIILFVFAGVALLAVLVLIVRMKIVTPSPARHARVEPGWTETRPGTGGLAYGVEEAGSDAAPHREEATRISLLNPNIG
jgi:hypothetical protein